MKKLYNTICLLVTLCFVETAIFMCFLDDIVPMHYDVYGNVNRMGSKFEFLIFPAITLVISAIIFLVARKESKKENGSNEKVLLYVGIIIGIFFLIFTFYIMMTKYKNVGSDINLSFQIIGILMGLIIVALGNIMPKARRNSIFGQRTKWSASSDFVWQKSQRFAGILSVIVGLIIVAISMFIKSELLFILIVSIVILYSVVSIYASYYYYKKEKEN